MNAFVDVQGQRAFWLLAINALLGELGVPIPVMPTALFMGAHVLRAWPDVVTLAGAMVAASLVGDLVWFAAGRRYGTDVLKLLCRFWLIPDEYGACAREAFEHWGSMALVAGRFVPGVLLIAPPLAGATGMSPVKFVGLTFVGAALYAVAVLGAGFLMRDQIDAVLLALQRLGWPLFIVVAAVLGAWTALMAWRLWRDHVRRAVHRPGTSSFERR
jgi:membrane protein DedA with SNARE-associated domain